MLSDMTDLSPQFHQQGAKNGINYFSSRNRELTNTVVVGAKHNEWGTLPTGEVLMTNAKEVPNFSQWSYERSAQDIWSKDDHNHSTELFQHQPSQILSAHFDPSIRHTMPTAVAIGAERAGSRTRNGGLGQIQADSSLTYRSAELSKRAAKKGLNVVGDESNQEMWTPEVRPSTMYPEREADVGLDPSTDDFIRTHGEGLTRASREDVASARQSVRTSLRNLHPNQFSEPTQAPVDPNQRKLF